MALNHSRVGHAYPAFAYEVSREKIREYALAVGETDPRYFSDGDDAVAPPTFAACFTVSHGAAAAMADPELGAHSKLVHGAQTFEYDARPMRPGDVLTCTPRVVSITVRGDNEFMDLEVDCRFADTDERAVRAVETVVFLGSAQSRHS